MCCKPYRLISRYAIKRENTAASWRKHRKLNDQLKKYLQRNLQLEINQLPVNKRGMFS